MNRDYQQLINDAIAAHAATVESLVAELAARIGDPLSLTPDELDARTMDILAEYEGRFADHVADAALQSFLRSAGHAAASIPSRRFADREMTDLARAAASRIDNIGGYPKTAAAAEALANRGIMTADEFYALGADERRKHFTVAGQHSEDVLHRIQQAISDILRTGPSLPEAEAKIRDAVVGEGSPLAPAHLETVYRVAVNQSYHDGLERVLEDPIVGEAFPYLYDSSIADGRRTELCKHFATAGIDGTAVYRADDPVYAKLRPARHFNCRCTVIPLTVKDAAKLGVREAQEWLRTGKPPEKVHRVRVPSQKLLKQGQGFVAMGLVPVRELRGAVASASRASRASEPSPAGIEMGFKVGKGKRWFVSREQAERYRKKYGIEEEVRDVTRRAKTGGDVANKGRGESNRSSSGSRSESGMRKGLIGRIAAVAKALGVSQDVDETNVGEVLEAILAKVEGKPSQAGKPAKSGEPDDAMLDEIVRIARPHTRSNLLSIPELYKQLKKRWPSLTLGQFHDALRQLYDEESVRLLGHTGHLAEIAYQREGVYLDGEVKYYIAGDYGEPRENPSERRKRVDTGKPSAPTKPSVSPPQSPQASSQDTERARRIFGNYESLRDRLDSVSYDQIDNFGKQLQRESPEVVKEVARMVGQAKPTSRAAAAKFVVDALYRIKGWRDQTGAIVGGHSKQDQLRQHAKTYAESVWPLLEQVDDRNADRILARVEEAYQDQSLGTEGFRMFAEELGYSVEGSKIEMKRKLDNMINRRAVTAVQTGAIAKRDPGPRT